MILIVDVDGTLTHDTPGVGYSQKLPRLDVIEKINALHLRGIRIALYSARNMRTYKGNIGLINKHTLPVMMEWLNRHGVRYDEIHMGKPWCGTDGFYIQSRSMRPDRFLNMPLSEIEQILTSEALEEDDSVYE